METKIARIAVVLCLNVALLWGAEYIWEHFDTAQGLPGTRYKAITVGPDGRIWAGGDDGISVYDGQTWAVFDTSDGLGSNIVTAIAVAPDSTIWVAGVSTVSWYDGNTWHQTALPVSHTDCVPMDPGDSAGCCAEWGFSMPDRTPVAKSIALTPSGAVWVSIVAVAPELTEFDIINMAVDSACATAFYAARFDPAAADWTTFVAAECAAPAVGDPAANAERFFWNLAADTAGNVWVGPARSLDSPRTGQAAPALYRYVPDSGWAALLETYNLFFGDHKNYIVPSAIHATQDGWTWVAGQPSDFYVTTPLPYLQQQSLVGLKYLGSQKTELIDPDTDNLAVNSLVNAIAPNPYTPARAWFGTYEWLALYDSSQQAPNEWVSLQPDTALQEGGEPKLAWGTGVDRTRYDSNSRPEGYTTTAKYANVGTPGDVVIRCVLLDENEAVAEPVNTNETLFLSS